MARSSRSATPRISVQINVIALLIVLLFPVAARAADSSTLTTVRFQLSVDCTCASCCFELQDRLHKTPGVGRVDISPRDKSVIVSFDESRSPLGDVAMKVNSTVLGKNSSLIGLFPTDEKPSPSDITSALPAIKSVDLDGKRRRLLVRLVSGSHVTTADLEAALAQKSVSVHFNIPDKK